MCLLLETRALDPQVTFEEHSESASPHESHAPKLGVQQVNKNIRNFTQDPACRFVAPRRRVRGSPRNEREARAESPPVPQPLPVILIRRLPQAAAVASTARRLNRRRTSVK